MEDTKASHDQLLTYREVAETLRLSERTVYTLVKRGDLPATRLGRSIRFRMSDVMACIERNSA